MGVDWYSCKRCGDTFPDCGDYVSCECGKSWCSDECAEKDGFKEECCKLGCNKDDDEMDNCIKKEQYDKDEYISCWDCEHHLDSSCKYCRNEDYDDETLLDKTLNLLGMSRDELITRINKDNGRN